MRDELDTVPADPRGDQVLPILNYSFLKIDTWNNLTGGVTRSDIVGIDPSNFPHERTSPALKAKCGIF